MIDVLDLRHAQMQALASSLPPSAPSFDDALRRSVLTRHARVAEHLDELRPLFFEREGLAPTTFLRDGHKWERRYIEEFCFDADGRLLASRTAVSGGGRAQLHRHVDADESVVQVLWVEGTANTVDIAEPCPEGVRGWVRYYWGPGSDGTPANGVKLQLFDHRDGLLTGVRRAADDTQLTGATRASMRSGSSDDLRYGSTGLLVRVERLLGDDSFIPYACTDDQAEARILDWYARALEHLLLCRLGTPDAVLAGIVLDPGSPGAVRLATLTREDARALAGSPGDALFDPRGWPSPAQPVDFDAHERPRLTSLDTHLRLADGAVDALARRIARMANPSTAALPVARSSSSQRATSPNRSKARASTSPRRHAGACSRR